MERRIAPLTVLDRSKLALPSNALRCAVGRSSAARLSVGRALCVAQPGARCPPDLV